MANKIELQKRRFELWIINPRCEKCGAFTVLPEMTGCGYYDQDGQFKLRYQPDNMATIQHKYFKKHPLRRTIPVPGERRWFLWCYKCNKDYNEKYERPNA